MNKHIITYLSIAIGILLATLAVLFIFLKADPSEKTVELFLESYIKNKDDRFLEFLSPSLKEHPFINLISHEYFIDFKILDSEKSDAGLSKVWVSIRLKDGTITVPFAVERIQNKNYIVSLPKTSNIDAAIPVEVTEKDKKTSICKIDVKGTHLYCLSISNSEKIEIGSPASFLLVEDYIINYEPMIATHIDKVMAVSQDYIEDSINGKIPIASEFAVYEIKKESVEYLLDSHIPIGIRDIVLYRPKQGNSKNKIAIIDRQNLPRNVIRVVLNNSNFNGLFHDEVTLSCDQAFTVKNIIDSQEYSFEKGDKITIRHDGAEAALYHEGVRLHSSPNRWYVEAKDDGLIVVNNIYRSHTHNKTGTPYRGTLEIAPSENGLVLVNEVFLEHYLYSVVPSEMPIRFGLEALKVQAIVARSYALRCLESKGFSSLGAHVDDSTASQVYNNIEEQPIAIQAVRETHGLVPFIGDEIVDTRFFSTSCGYTANAHEVWSYEDQFPGLEIPYLSAKAQFPGDVPSLYNEENFRAFIDQKEINGYDKFSPYFRWTVDFTRQQLEAVINKHLSELQKSQPSFILTKGTDGNFVSKEIPEDIGELQNIEVVRRGEGGNIMELEISTTHGTFKIIKELNIRRLLQPINLVAGEEPIQLKCHDGTILTDLPLLPSAFAYIETHRDANGQLTSVRIKGGGYGHGVGLSQYGCYGLTLMGKSYDEIIEHYYPGAELRTIY